jgi:hypothetical protein
MPNFILRNVMMHGQKISGFSIQISGGFYHRDDIGMGN